MLAVSADGLCAGSPASEALFKCAARFASKRVHYQGGLYKSPWGKDEATVRDISASFKKQRTSFNDGLKRRAMLEGLDAAIVNEDREERRCSGPLRSTKAKSKAAAAKTKSAGARVQARKKE